MVGQILINFLFASAVVSSGAYFLSLKNHNEMLQRTARMMFYIVCVGMLIAAGMAVFHIMTHDFRYSYVWGHSSKELSTPLLIATFYAGQEGSFMLWTLLVSMIGFSLLPYVHKHRYESEVMGFYGVILSFLLLMLVAKSPFAYVWESYPKDVPYGFMPQNGKGLNPLLQNLWITIHPPILFTGFASMSVPFAFAMAGLIRKEYHQWVSVSLPWVLFGTAILGFGIMLGGFWAYETLGWGGFWGWDPVENSSLLPWLVAVALTHTMLTQKKTKGLVKTNFVLAVMTFLLVLYSTFLTRSGVLGDTSVHSFVDPGFFAYTLLLSFVIVFAVVGFGMILWRSKDIGAIKTEFAPTSREFALGIGSALMLASAVIVFIGTSWPLMAEIFKQPKVAIDIAFYNKMHLPLVIMVALLNGASLLLKWRATTPRDFARQIVIPFVIAGVATVICVAFGVHDPAFALLTFGAFFGLSVNANLAVRILKGNPTFAGAYISHFGLALLFLGIVATSRYSVTEHVRLPMNTPTQALGYTFMFLGKEQVEKDYKDREKFHYFVSAEKDGKETIVKPVLYWSDYNQRQSAFLEPGIRWSALQDLYIAPKAVEIEGEAPAMQVQREVPQPLVIDSTIRITLLGFDTSDMTNPNRQQDRLKLGAILSIERADSAFQTTLYTTFLMGGANAQAQYEPFQIPGTTYFLAMQRAMPNMEDRTKSQAIILASDSRNPATSPREVFTIEVSIKPFINLVWGGVLLMVAGFFISIVRRRKELLREDTVRDHQAIESTMQSFPVQAKAEHAQE
jgi:cytochrome c-type biogenesis protein CcmF